jgi:hypothetical protein
MTSERVRQIELTKHRKRCKVHNRYYYNKCSHCLAESYMKMILDMNLYDVLKEVQKEANNRKRDYLSSQRRVFLIKVLFEEYEYSFTDIAEMLHRDRSTIIHLSKQYE